VEDEIDIPPEGDEEKRVPKLAIIGRPNVGKSTLFNRLVGKKLAIVNDTPGVTRDIRDASARLRGRELHLMDTAGFENAKGDSLEARMRAQTEAAVTDCDVCLFVYDARAGLTPLDRIFAWGTRLRCLLNIISGLSILMMP